MDEKQMDDLRAEAEDFTANVAIDREREDRPTTYVTENLDYKERGPVSDRDARETRALALFARMADALDRIEADLDGIRRCLRR